jgi:hypothetical protein
VESREPEPRRSLGTLPWHVTFLALTVVAVPLVWVALDPGWLRLRDGEAFGATVTWMVLVLGVSFALSGFGWWATVASGSQRRLALAGALVLAVTDVALAWLVVASSRA